MIKLLVESNIDMAANFSNSDIQMDHLVEYQNCSNDILDTKPSSRYSITLEEARNRALRAIKKARKKCVDTILI